MMADMIHVKTYDAPEYDIREILRYAGCGKAEAEELPLLKDCLAVFSNQAAGKWAGPFLCGNGFGGFGQESGWLRRRGSVCGDDRAGN